MCARVADLHSPSSTLPIPPRKACDKNDVVKGVPEAKSQESEDVLKLKAENTRLRSKVDKFRTSAKELKNVQQENAWQSAGSKYVHRTPSNL